MGNKPAKQVFAKGTHTVVPKVISVKDKTRHPTVYKTYECPRCGKLIRKKSPRTECRSCMGRYNPLAVSISERSYNQVRKASHKARKATRAALRKVVPVVDLANLDVTVEGGQVTLVEVRDA